MMIQGGEKMKEKETRIFCGDVDDMIFQDEWHESER